MSTYIHNRRREEGFTLIELMIVMVVIGILAGIVLFAVGNFSTQATTSKNQANVRICATANAAYKAANNGAVAPNVGALDPYLGNGTAGSGAAAAAGCTAS